MSGGQKQRVAVAGVLAMRPRIIVFDESTAMLDPIGRRDVFALARRLNVEEGITVVWITHFMEEAAQADRILVVDQGALTASGTPKEVFRQEDLLRAAGLDVPETETAARIVELSAYLREQKGFSPMRIGRSQRLVYAAALAAIDALRAAPLKEEDYAKKRDLLQTLLMSGILLFVVVSMAASAH